MNTPRSASDIIRAYVRGDIQPAGGILAFVFGAVFALPINLVLIGQWVRGLQVSILLASAVAILAASSPWWVDAIEQREIDRVLDVDHS